MNRSLIAVAVCTVSLCSLIAAGCNSAAPEKDQETGKETSQANNPPAKEQSPATLDLDRVPKLTDEELAEGWILLFDGQTFFGWEKGAEINWQIKDGVLWADSGEVGLLHTTTEFANYVLKVDFRAAKGTNSGVFLRTPADPEDPASDCYELNIAPPDNPFPTGSFVKREKVTQGESDQWRTYEAMADGGHFVVKLDGETVLDYTDENPVPRGHIGLQKNEGKIEFRNVKLKPLGMKSIFSGQDLSGWQEVPDGKSKWSVQEGKLHVEDGRGALETAGKYADFVLQMEVFVGGDDLNSGIFFRCIPGENMNGYESQIHNGYKNGDRTQPTDHGTGGIFRRQPARIVVADDQQWFHQTIIADGPHMAVWVGGIQVSDWTDTRQPDPNPRKGLRTEAGTLQIQGHDPTTNLDFRHIRISEMPARKSAE